MEQEQDTDSFSICELVIVLRSIFVIDVKLFRSRLVKITTFCSSFVSASRSGNRHISLHLVRLLNAFTATYGKRWKCSYQANAVGEEEYDADSVA